MAKEKFNISFKQQPRETGLRSVGHPYPTVDIKVNKKVVGTINPPTWHTKDHKWRVTLRLAKGDNWVVGQIKHKFDDDQTARQWVKENLKTIHEKNPLHFQEDD